MGFVLNTAGPTTILTTTAAAVGNWYRTNPRYGKLGFQLLHTGTSLGSTVQSTCWIQASNDGVNPLLDTGGATIGALATLITNGGSPQSVGAVVDNAWAYIRANLNATSTGTITVMVFANRSA